MTRFAIVMGVLLAPLAARADATSAWMTTSIEAGREIGPGGELGAPRLTQSIGWYFGDDRDGLTAGLRLLGENNAGLARVGGGPWVGYTLRFGFLAVGPTAGISYVRTWATETGVSGTLHGAEGYAAVDIRADFGPLIIAVRPFSVRGLVTEAFADVRGEVGLGVGLAF